MLEVHSSLNSSLDSLLGVHREGIRWEGRLEPFLTVNVSNYAWMGMQGCVDYCETVVNGC